MTEAFLHIRRNVTPGTWVRCLKGLPPGTTPGEFALVDREVVAWSLTSTGQPVRYWYVRVDVADDGFGPFAIDPVYPHATAYDGSDISLTACYRPIRDREAPDAAKLEESYHRRAARLHWASYHIEQDRKREEQLKADKERVRLEMLEYVARNNLPVRPKPKPHWFLRLLGSK